MQTQFDAEETVSDPRLFGMFVGYVVNREDPKRLGRVQVCIPGFIEPHSAWSWPLGTCGGGSKNRGFFAVPELNAEVCIFFNQGKISAPYYITTNWGMPDGQSEVPEEAQKSPPNNRVIATETFRIEMDESENDHKLRLLNKRTQDQIILDADQNSIVIKGTTAIVIQAVGAITLDAAQISIKGRAVRPVDSAI
jgi:hypothetical protein